MFISRFFKVRYLVALVLLVVLVAAVGNAAALTITNTPQNVVQGETNYAGADATVAYTIDGSGNVIAEVTFDSAFAAVSASFDGGSTYSACTGAGTDWQCQLDNADIAAAPSIDLVAVSPIP